VGNPPYDYYPTTLFGETRDGIGATFNGSTAPVFGFEAINTEWDGRLASSMALYFKDDSVGVEVTSREWKAGDIVFSTIESPIIPDITPYIDELVDEYLPITLTINGLYSKTRNIRVYRNPPP
jgi:hypothetical protein